MVLCNWVMWHFPHYDFHAGIYFLIISKYQQARVRLITGGGHTYLLYITSTRHESCQINGLGKKPTPPAAA